MTIQKYDHLGLNQNELQEAVFERLDDFPADPAPVNGQFFYHTGQRVAYLYDTLIPGWIVFPGFGMPIPFSTPGGRLTLQSGGVPVTNTDQIGKTDLIYTPYIHDNINLWNGTFWAKREFPETTIPIGTVTPFVPRDVFAFDNAGVPAFEHSPFYSSVITVTIASPGVVTDTAHGMANGDPIVFTTDGALPTGLVANTRYWIMNSTADTYQLCLLTDLVTAINTSGSQSGTHTAWQRRRRVADLQFLGGKLCKNADQTRLHIGTFEATSATTTEDSFINGSSSGSKRMLANTYNQVERLLGVKEDTNSWSYSTAVWRQARATLGNQVEFVVPTLGGVVWAALNFQVDTSSVKVVVAAGLGLNSTKRNDGKGGLVTVENLAGLLNADGSCDYVGMPGIGGHYLSWNEYGSGAVGTQSWYGNSSHAVANVGIIGSVMA
jgi:hypothetical protein